MKQNQLINKVVKEFSSDDDWVCGHAEDTAYTSTYCSVSLDSEKSVLTPIGAPRVLSEPVVDTSSVGAIANKINGMIQ